ncbi:MAG: enoyl-CoA hydratase/isomerase family protein [Methylocystaceae bacterium]|nr:enoyl-CoA hydratase/isomerase family protein [Methylocystaceae bacterium]
MTHNIKKVGVIGAGVMGAGIAAQAANGGAEVVLLDIVPDGAEDRNAIAAGAKARFLKAGANGGFMGQEAAARLSVGNTEDNMDLLADCDWIVEVIIERLDIKQSLFKRIEEVRKDGSVVSSNTSTIPLASLMEGMPQRLRENFIVTHYFNPPRHMRLLEIVKGEDTEQSCVDRVAEFNDIHMGKTVIHCADRPGFIANRLGVFWMQASVYEAQNTGLSIEEADAIMSGPCGYPSTGIFGLWDLCGLDLMPDVTASLGSLLPESDAFAPYAKVMPSVTAMVEKGLHGRKGRVYQGFYRVTKSDDGKRIKETINLENLEYRPVEKSSLASSQLKKGQLKELLASTDKGGAYGWKVLSQVLNYASTLIPDVAGDITSVDKAMKLGYNWAFGPFEMIDLIGTKAFVERLEAENLPVSDFLKQADGRPLYIFEDGINKCMGADGNYQPIEKADGILLLSDLEQQNALVEATDTANVWDLGDDVWCLEFRTKMNTLPRELLENIETIIDKAEAQNKAIVLYNEGPVFAAGANLADLVERVSDKEFVHGYISYGQKVFMKLKYAKVPVVGAPAGRAFGGGVEILMHCHAVQAHSELYIGLVENNVGILPGWGGTKELLIRSMESFGAENAISNAYKVIQGAMVSGSAMHAKELCYLRQSDGITMNRDRLLLDAKELAISLRGKTRTREVLPAVAECAEPDFATDGYQATLERVTFETMLPAQQEDWEDALLAKELENVISLCVTPQAIERMQHMLKTGKPLKN